MEVKNFLSYCRLARNLSPATCTHYENVVCLFETYCITHDKGLREACQRDVIDYLMFLSSDGLKAVTINNRLIILRQFYDYCMRFEGWRENPCAGVKALRQPKPLPRFIEKHVLDAALSAIDVSTYEGRARHAAFAFAYMTGARLSEIASVRPDDVSLFRSSVRILGKGSKERIVPIPDTLKAILRDYISERMQQPTTEPWLFLTQAGNKHNRSSFERLVLSVLAGRVTRDLAHPHMLRHSYATILMLASVPLQRIQLYLGHASIETTMRYLAVTQMQSDFNQLNNVF